MSVHFYIPLSDPYPLDTGLRRYDGWAVMVRTRGEPTTLVQVPAVHNVLCESAASAEFGMRSKGPTARRPSQVNSGNKQKIE